MTDDQDENDSDSFVERWVKVAIYGFVAVMFLVPLLLSALHKLFGWNPPEFLENLLSSIGLL